MTATDSPDTPNTDTIDAPPGPPSAEVLAVIGRHNVGEMLDERAVLEPDVLELIDQALADDEVARAIAETRDAATDYEAHPVLDVWAIDGERTATWALAKLAAAHRRRDEANATADRLITIANEHVARVEAATDADVGYFTAKLREYHEAEIRGTRRKSTPLPGDVTLKTTPGGISTVIDDEAKVVAWCEDHRPGAVVYAEPSVKKAELKDLQGKVDKTEPGEYPAVEPETGEIVDGVRFVRSPGNFVIDLPR